MIAAAKHDGEEILTEELPQAGPTGLPSAVPDQATLPDQAPAPSAAPEARREAAANVEQRQAPAGAQVNISMIIIISYLHVSSSWTGCVSR